MSNYSGDGVMRHRGVQVLIFAILSLPLVFLPLGGIAIGRTLVRTARFDLAIIESGYMDPRGRAWYEASSTLGWIIFSFSIAYTAIFTLLVIGVAATHNS